MLFKAYIGAVVLNTDISGNARRIFDICNTLLQKKYKVTIFTYDGVPPEWMKVNASIRPFEYLDFEYPDVIICPDYENYDFIRDISAKLKIVFLHNKAFLKKYLKISNEHRSIIFTMDEENIKYFPQDKIVYFPFGINVNFFVDRQTDYTNVADKNILFITQNTDNICDYFSFINQIYDDIDNPSVKFFVLCKNIKYRPVNARFCLLGNVDNSKLLELYRSTYIGIDLRNELEWNNSVLELLSIGRPVICFPDGAKAFVRNFYNSFFINKYDIDFLNGLISILINDKLFYNYIKNNTRAQVNDFSYEKGIEKLENVFKNYGII